MQDFLIAAVWPHLLSIGSILGPLLIDHFAETVIAGLGWIGARWGILKIEEQHRAALHSAIVSGVKAAIRSGITTREGLVEYALGYARESVPKAIKRLKASEETLQDLIEAKAGDLDPAAMAKHLTRALF